MNEVKTLIIGDEEYCAERKNINLLGIGNSYCFVTLTLLPLVLETMLPNYNINITLLHRAGAKMAEHANHFTDSSTFYEGYFNWNNENKQWERNYANIKTGPQVLAEKPWNIIMLHQTSTISSEVDGVTYQHQTDISSLNKFAKYLTESVDGTCALVLNLGQAPHPGYEGINTLFPADSLLTSSNAYMETMANYGKLAIDSPYITSILPAGTAVQNLRSCSFAANSGVKGYFSNDDAGHLEITPALLTAALADALKIAELVGESPLPFGKEYLYSTETITSARLMAEGTWNPSITQIRMAQIAAMAAIKDPYHVTNLASYE